MKCTQILLVMGWLSGELANSKSDEVVGGET